VVEIHNLIKMSLWWDRRYCTTGWRDN